MGFRGVPRHCDDVAGMLAADLEQFARTSGTDRLTPIIGRLRRPVCVAILGRAGVGVRTVGAALAARGVPVVAGPAGDVTVIVVNDAVRDEERAALSVTPGAVLAFAKADLCAARPHGPMAVARELAASIASDLGVPTVPVAALLADVVLDDGDVAALRALTSATADLSSVDAFVAGADPVDRAARVRLLTRLDRFGVAHAVAALLRGADPATLPAILREAANVDALVDVVRARLAAARYARVASATIELRCLAEDFGDITVFAAMSAAVEVLEADGLAVDRGDDAPAHLRRATHWRRYGRGPVGAVHRACSADVVRGSLRLLDEAP